MAERLDPEVVRAFQNALFETFAQSVTRYDGFVEKFMGDAYTIADIATFPWVRNLIGFYEAGDLVGIQDFPQVTRALDQFLARPAVVRGLGIPGQGATR